VNSSDVRWKNPITGIAGCCARAASGHAAAAPRSVMSSRRFTTQCLHASTEKDSTMEGSAAVRDFNPFYDRFGSKAAEMIGTTRRVMSASRPGCVKTHTSAKCRKHNSPARHRTWRVQYDLTLRDAIASRCFYV